MHFCLSYIHRLDHLQGIEDCRGELVVQISDNRLWVTHVGSVYTDSSVVRMLAV